ncbi:MAG: type II toxin-antitoxin system VapC family toxin [Gemmatimonadetes bacterium]|nr:type II toxin-antitoxin system VapC family toxin [Gemmatimonadota bacterium]
MLLLDTHVWLWTVQGARERMSEPAVQSVEEASRRGAILISAISVWEVAMLEARGRIRLSRSVSEWTAAALRGPGVRLLELTPEIAIHSTRLPGDVHGDAANRILIASARVAGATLVTADESILSYAQQGHLLVLDARR